MPETEAQKADLSSKEQKADLSSTLLWTLTTPIDNISPENSGAIVQWLEDRSKVASSFNTVITASLVLFTLFGKPGFKDVTAVLLSISALLIFISLLINVICLWQIPKWKLAVATGQIKDGRRMALDLEISSWISLICFLAALVLTAITNSTS